MNQFQLSVHPGLLPVLVGARLDEELDLHLLELAGAEDEVAGSDLVAERLADLPMPNGGFLRAVCSTFSKFVKMP